MNDRLNPINPYAAKRNPAPGEESIMNNRLNTIKAVQRPDVSKIISDPVINDAVNKSGGDVLIDRATGAVNTITDAPNKAREKADKLTNQLIDFAEKLEQSVTGVATANLKQSKGAGIGAKVGMWFAQGDNAVYAIGGLIALVIGILIVRR